MLLARIDQVVDHYAPAAPGAHTAFGKYFTLNPGRADRSVGSFYVHMNGSGAGRWADHAMPPLPGSRAKCDFATGDILDLIALSCGCDTRGALTEARAFLGLSTQSPEERRRQEQRAAELKRRRAQQDRADQDKRSKRENQALAIYLSGQQQLRDTPVHHYLRDTRGVDLATLPRQPGVIRFVPDCYYQHTDEKTGEYEDGRYPAMVALFTDKAGKPAGIHRTYLQRNAAGLWDKAPIMKPKKVLGWRKRTGIQIWKGLGPRGGKPCSLKDAAPGQHILITEGIEDALSAACLKPDARVFAAYSLSNLGAIDLPACVSAVTIVADLDDSDTAREALQRALARHQNAGRTVRLFQNQWGGKDLNDALRAAQTDKGAA
ncbi:MAG: toprim domain-containing protein [Pseudomonadota bacterium]